MTAILIAIWKDPTLKMESKGPDHLTPESPKWSQLRSWALNLLRYKFPSLLQPVLIEFLLLSTITILSTTTCKHEDKYIKISSTVA